VLDSLLRLYCGLSRRGQPVELVHVANVGPGNEVAVDVHGHLDRAVPHLIPDVGERGARLNQEASKGVAQVVKADGPKPRSR
jgi:hypothetical protein